MEIFGKTYGQPCPIARTLDVLGDRWTLLIIREFLLGPKRFKDLLAVLPAMGTNRLSSRLNLLVTNDVIQRTAGKNSIAYELTERGEGLRRPVMGLGQWGLSLPLEIVGDFSGLRAELIAMSLSGIRNPAAYDGLPDVYEFEVGHEIFHIFVQNNEIITRSGRCAAGADVKIILDIESFIALIARKITVDAAIGTGRCTLRQGEKQAVARIFQVLEHGEWLPAFEQVGKRQAIIES
jgi:DNA-binding HxlR family transcriptional regulator